VIDPQVLESLTALIIQGGAVIVLVWVVTLLVTGRLHTDSEVDGLRRDKADLLAINDKLSDALANSNELLRVAIKRES
jgi:hypothetical protein